MPVNRNTNTQTHKCTHEHAHTHTNTQTHKCTHEHTHTNTQTHTQTHTHTHTHTQDGQCLTRTYDSQWRHYGRRQRTRLHSRLGEGDCVFCSFLSGKHVLLIQLPLFCFGASSFQRQTAVCACSVGHRVSLWWNIAFSTADDWNRTQLRRQIDAHRHRKKLCLASFKHSRKCLLNEHLLCRRES